MSIPGFYEAQARYDSMLPEDPPIFRCPISGEMNEDCDRDGHECEDAEEDDRDEEPADFDERRWGRIYHDDDFDL